MFSCLQRATQSSVAVVRVHCPDLMSQVCEHVVWSQKTFMCHLAEVLTFQEVEVNGLSKMPKALAEVWVGWRCGRHTAESPVALRAASLT